MSTAVAFMGDLQEAKRPGILVGGGAHKARAAIMAFALQHSIPVFRTWNALDVATDDHMCYAGTVGTYGGPGRNFGIQNCDLLLILGCRISGRITGGTPATFARGAKRYWVDVDSGLLAEHEVKPHVAVCADAGEFIAECTRGYFADWKLNFTGWLERNMVLVGKYDPVEPDKHLYPWHHYGFMRELSHALPANAIVTYDTGGNAIMMGHCFKSKAGQRIFSSNGNSAMGFAMCGAIGAWFAEPQRPIICIIGDGGFQLNSQECQTLVHYKIPVKVFILNNKILGNTLAYQIQNGKAQIACSPEGGYSSPDFQKLASAYGIENYGLGEWSRFDHVVGSALNSTGPVIVDVLHERFCDYRPRMSLWDGGVEEMYPPLPDDEFTGNMIIPPVDGWQERRKRYKDIK